MSTSLKIRKILFEKANYRASRGGIETKPGKYENTAHKCGTKLLFHTNQVSKKGTEVPS